LIRCLISHSPLIRAIYLHPDHSTHHEHSLGPSLQVCLTFRLPTLPIGLVLVRVRGNYRLGQRALVSKVVLDLISVPAALLLLGGHRPHIPIDPWWVLALGWSLMVGVFLREVWAEGRDFQVRFLLDPFPHSRLPHSRLDLLPHSRLPQRLADPLQDARYIPHPLLFSHHLTRFRSLAVSSTDPLRISLMSVGPILQIIPGSPLGTVKLDFSLVSFGTCTKHLSPNRRILSIPGALPVSTVHATCPFLGLDVFIMITAAYRAAYDQYSVGRFESANMVDIIPFNVRIILSLAPLSSGVYLVVV
jgi:hypothetical protein